LCVHFLFLIFPTLINHAAWLLHVAKGLLITAQLPWRCVPFVSIDTVLSASVLHASMFGPLHPGLDRQSWGDHVKSSSKECPLLQYEASAMQEAQQHHEVHNA